MASNWKAQSEVEITKNSKKNTRYLDDENLPIFYDPEEVLWLGTWLNRGAIISVLLIIVINVPAVFRLKLIVQPFFIQDSMPEIVPWIIAIIVGGLTIALQCFLTYFFLKSLATILTVLMSMELDSRDFK